MNHRTKINGVFMLPLVWFASMCPVNVAIATNVASSDSNDGVKHASNELKTEVVEALLGALGDENPQVRMNSLRSIQSIGCDAKQTREAVLQLIKLEQVADVRCVAFEVIQSVVSDRKVLNQMVADLVTTAKQPEVRRGATSVLAELPRSRDNIRILMRALNDTDSRVRASAAEALGNLKASRHRQPVLDGYCPVTLLNSEKWVRGNPNWTYTYRGLHYQFTSRSSREDFISDPNRYAIVSNGLDVVFLLDKAKKIPGAREHGVIYRDRVYLFSSELSLETFWHDPDRYVSADRRELQKQPLEQPPGGAIAIRRK